jgi:hypothetical protein
VITKAEEMMRKAFCFDILLQNKILRKMIIINAVKGRNMSSR